MVHCLHILCKKKASQNLECGISLLDVNTTVPPYPQRIHLKTPSGCLKPQIIPSPICTVIFPIYIFIYLFPFFCTYCQFLVHIFYICLLLKFFFLRLYLFIFRERGREAERERNIDVWLPLLHPVLGTWPTTQACALTGN